MSYIKQILDYFFKHDIPENLKSRVYQRLSNPRDDSERDKALKQLWDEIDMDTSEDWEKAYGRIESVMRKKSNKNARLHSIQYWVRIAAVWLIPFIMMCTSGYFFISSTNSDEVGEPEISFVQYYAELDRREQVTLPDGSKVWLNSGSTLIYPSTFTMAERGVYLNGEGFFEVTKDAEHPFVVNTRFLKMRVLGTTFNVSAYPDDKQVKTTLETGALKVSLLNDTTISYYLKPDDQLVYIPSTNKVEYVKVKASDYSDWRMGGLFFNNTDFEYAMQIIERTYGVKVHIRTSVYNKQKIYVHYNKHESLEDVFHILKLMIPELDYRISGKEVYIE